MSATTAGTTSILLSEDFFGVSANAFFRKLTEGSKPERKDAFNGVKTLAKVAGLLSSKEKVLSVSVGCNVSGARLIILTLEAPKVLQSSLIAGPSLEGDQQ
jgi:hypothetical protein